MSYTTLFRSVVFLDHGGEGKVEAFHIFQIGRRRDRKIVRQYWLTDARGRQSRFVLAFPIRFKAINGPPSRRVEIELEIAFCTFGFDEGFETGAFPQAACLNRGSRRWKIDTVQITEQAILESDRDPFPPDIDAHSVNGARRRVREIGRAHV